MSDADDDRSKAAEFPEGDLLNVLYTHHARVHDLLDEVESTSGEARKQAFDEVTTLLKAHEAAEESVVRPVTAKTAGKDEARARNEEEQEADHVALALSKLDLDSADFDKQFAKFKKAVTKHAEAEEKKEFPTIESKRSPEDRQMLGKQFVSEFQAAGGR